MDNQYVINGQEVTKEHFFGALTELAQEAIKIAPTAGDYTPEGLVYHFADDRNWL